MNDYEIYAENWMRAIRAKNIHTALKQAKTIMEKERYYTVRIKRHDKDGYPTEMGVITRAPDPRRVPYYKYYYLPNNHSRSRRLIR